MERPALVYLLIVLGISILARVRAHLDRKPGWKSFFGFLFAVEVTFIALLLGALIFFGCLQIFLRNFLHSGVIWADPLMRHIVLWLGCLGGVMATARIRHISIDVFTRLLSGPLQNVRDKIIYLVTAAASSVLGLAALKLVVDEREFGEKTFLNMDVWVLQAILPVAFFLITYRSLVNFLLGRKAKPIDWEETSRNTQADV
ncbi:MAG: TRAP transporter small permease [Candidatus Krumholzibacteria bacterium]|nr:TRAP transporter small permease [Candidatus Krumholzibacteria bacterium]